MSNDANTIARALKVFHDACPNLFPRTRSALRSYVAHWLAYGTPLGTISPSDSLIDRVTDETWKLVS